MSAVTDKKAKDALESAFDILCRIEAGLCLMKEVEDGKKKKPEWR